MIICLCNRLGSSHLEAACAAGVREACDFYAREGCAVNCGKCVDFVEAFIDRRASEHQAIHSLAGSALYRGQGHAAHGHQPHVAHAAKSE